MERFVIETVGQEVLISERTYIGLGKRNLMLTKIREIFSIFPECLIATNGIDYYDLSTLEDWVSVIEFNEDFLVKVRMTKEDMVMFKLQPQIMVELHEELKIIDHTHINYDIEYLLERRGTLPKRWMEL